MEGYTILTAQSGPEAIAVLSTKDIDLLITDENMPGMSGTDLLKTVCDMYPQVVRIMLTGASDIEVAKKAINSGEIYKFFTKPWDDFELLVSVKYALKLKQLEKENVKLKSVIKGQENLLNKLEKEYPGISKKKLTADGSIIID